MDHGTFLQSVSAEDRTAFTTRSDLYGLIHLFTHFGAIMIVAALILQGWWWLIPVQGVLIVFLFTLEHECTHQTPFATKTLNESVGHLCGFALLLPFRWFRYFHLAHHKWTNIAGKDPELEGDFPKSGNALLWHISGIPYWMSMACVTFALASGRPVARYIPTAAIAPARLEARLMIVGYCLVLSLFPTLFWIWVIPVIIGQPALRLYLLAEHGDCPQVANMFANTRTTFTNRAMCWLAWNMPYHTEHHVWPSVPFSKLPILSKRLKDHLQVTSPGYIAFQRDFFARHLQRPSPTANNTETTPEDGK